jgi:hypothetical protein
MKDDFIKAVIEDFILITKSPGIPGRYVVTNKGEVPISSTEHGVIRIGKGDFRIRKNLTITAAFPHKKKKEVISRKRLIEYAIAAIQTKKQNCEFEMNFAWCDPDITLRAPERNPARKSSKVLLDFPKSIAKELKTSFFETFPLVMFDSVWVRAEAHLV